MWRKTTLCDSALRLSLILLIKRSYLSWMFQWYLPGLMKRRSASLQDTFLVCTERYSGSAVTMCSRDDFLSLFSGPYKLSLLWISSTSAQLWSWAVLEIIWGLENSRWLLQSGGQKGWSDDTCINDKTWIHAIFIPSGSKLYYLWDCSVWMQGYENFVVYNH